MRSAHFIGGQYVEGKPNTIDVKRPSDGVSYAGLPVADADLVDQAVQDSWSAFKSSDWARRAPRDRARVTARQRPILVGSAIGIFRMCNPDDMSSGGDPTHDRHACDHPVTDL